MAKCKHETKNGRCGLKESYAYRKECHTEEFCRCHESIEPCGRNEPMTNADRIRAMSDEELSVFLANPCECTVDPSVDGYRECGNKLCIQYLLEWLQQPAEVE